jgi:hypothetical protein
VHRFLLDWDTQTSQFLRRRIMLGVSGDCTHFFICMYLIKWPLIRNKRVQYETYPGMTRNYKWREKLMLNISATRTFPEFPICSPYNMATIHIRICIPLHLTWDKIENNGIATVCNILTHLNFIYSLYKMNIGHGVQIRQSVHISMFCPELISQFRGRLVLRGSPLSCQWKFNLVHIVLLYSNSHFT